MDSTGHPHRRVLPWAIALGLAASVPTSDAAACGQSTHIWIALQAVSYLPDGHPLKALLQREDLEASLVNGAMFPDGGYSPLTQDGYGETAHWEPFQTAWLASIREQHPGAPDDAAADEDVAFLMGLAAHGMADQIYDGVYLTRSQLHDTQSNWAQSDVDFSTDVVTTSRLGPQPLVDDVVPYDALVDVFAAYGQPTSRTTIEVGQASLRVAVQYIGNLGQDPEQAAPYLDAFPWAAAYLQDPTVACSPACMQPAIAAYWLTLWDRLSGTYDPSAHPVFAAWPADGGELPSRDADSADATVSVAFSRAVDVTTLTPDRVTVRDGAGEVVPIGFRLYYGDRTNVLNVWSVDGWPDDEDFTLELSPGITSFDGLVVDAPWSTTFTTRDPVATEAEACGGCRTGAGPAWLVVVALAARRRRT